MTLVYHQANVVLARTNPEKDEVTGFGLERIHRRGRPALGHRDPGDPHAGRSVGELCEAAAVQRRSGGFRAVLIPCTDL